MIRELIASSLFLTTILILIITKEEKRAYVALFSAILAIILGLVKPSHIIEYLNLDVLGLIAGASIISAYLIESGVTSWAASKALNASKGDLRKLSLYLGMLSGIISLFIENVTTLIMLAPIAFEIARSFELDAVPLLLIIAFASNLGGAALLVGDPQSALAAGYFNLDFIDFIFHDGKPSIFWMVLAALIVSTFSFAYVFIKGKIKVEEEVLGGIRDSALAKVTLIALGIKIFLLSIRKMIGIGLSLPAIIGASIILAFQIIRKRKAEDIRFALKSVDWKLLLFLGSLFVLVGSLQDTGVMNLVAVIFEKFVSCNFYQLTATLIVLSVLISGIMDNIPYLLAMFPVIEYLSKTCHIYYFKLLLALLIGATLGGNVTYFGTSTNITAVQLLYAEGYRVSFKRFLKYGLFYTVMALLPAVILFYLVWG